MEAAKQSEPEGQFCLALCYCEGEGVTKSVTDYVFWLRCAQLNGHDRALQHMRERMSDSRYRRAWEEMIAEADQKIAKRETYIRLYFEKQAKKELEQKKKPERGMS